MVYTSVLETDAHMRLRVRVSPVVPICINKHMMDLNESIMNVMSEGAAESAAEVKAIEKIVSTLKVGDKTNFGVVSKLDSTSVSFKSKDLGVNKIAFKARKIGSKDFVLTQLTKI